MLGGRWPPIALPVAMLLAASACTGSPKPRAQAPTNPSARIGASSSSSVLAVPQRRTGHPSPRALHGSSRWRLSRPADGAEIEGYADPLSTVPGRRVELMVSTSAKRFRVIAYRMGGYRGGAGRLVWASPSLPGHRQSAPRLSGRTRTITAGWPPSTSVDTSGWPPGFYLLKLVASSRYEAYIPLVVRSTTTQGRVALVAPTMTWEAYNT